MGVGSKPVKCSVVGGAKDSLVTDEDGFIVGDTVPEGDGFNVGDAANVLEILGSSGVGELAGFDPQAPSSMPKVTYK